MFLQLKSPVHTTYLVWGCSGQDLSLSMMESQPTTEDGSSTMQTQNIPQLLSFSLTFGCHRPQSVESCHHLPRPGHLQDAKLCIANSHLSFLCFGSRRAELQIHTPTLTSAMTSKQLMAVKSCLPTAPVRWVLHHSITAI